MDKTRLKALLRDACITTFDRFVKEHGRENLAGFALYTSEGFPNIGPIGATTACEGDETLFSTDEWDLMPRDDAAQQVNALLAKAYEEGEAGEEDAPDWFEEYCDACSSSCVDVLEQLINEGIFGSESDRDTLFIVLGVSDSLKPFTDGVEWSRRLNTTKMHARYETFAAQVSEQGYY